MRHVIALAIACGFAAAGCESSFPLGTGCSLDSACASGFCVDGRCCESACAAPNDSTTLQCSLGKCLVVECAAGFANCSDDPEVGCIDITNDPDNCGACATSCAAEPSIATRACTAGACTSTCEAGFANCTGTIGAAGCDETTTTIAQCGACGVSCVDSDPADCTNDLCDGTACTNVPRLTCGQQLCVAACGGIAAANDGDADGLNDVAEARGFVDSNCNGVDDGAAIDLRLPGAATNRKTIFLEYDYMSKAGQGNTCVNDAGCAVPGEQCMGTCSVTTGRDCAATSECPGGETCVALVCTHSHRPKPAALAAVVTAFAGRNIDLVIEPAPTRLAEVSVVTFDSTLPASCAGVGAADFFALKAANFDPRRRPFYHYAVFGHHSTCGSAGACAACAGTPAPQFGATGTAEQGGNDLIISMGALYGDLATPRTLANEAGVIMHELGHNLGLLHGGNEARPDGKPNYFSVMNRAYMLTGITSPTTGTRIDFSGATLAALDESALIEAAGVNEAAADPLHGDDLTRFTNDLGVASTGPGTGAVDWSGNGAIDPGTLATGVDLNADGTLGLMTGFNDWANLVLPFQCTAAGSQ